MKRRILTIDEYINESKLNESQDVDKFINALETDIEQQGGKLYQDDLDSDTAVYIVSPVVLKDSEVTKMFNDGRPKDNAAMFAIEPHRIGPDDISVIADCLKTAGLKDNVKMIAKKYL